MDSNLDLERGLNSQQKRPFLLEGGDGKKSVQQVDRISDLPDHIIAQVLSCLGTREAIGTSILSSRWRYLWKDITRISLFGAFSDPLEFTNNFEHVLQNCSPTNLVEFDLSCPSQIDLSRLNTWVETVLISPNIQKLNLRINNFFDEFPKPPFPICIHSCNMLVVLELGFCFDIQIPESIVSFPCLKLLDIHVMFPDHESVVNRLLSCCPVLENLDLRGYIDFPEVLKLEISSSTLRKLSVKLREERGHYINEYDIIIDTPNLKSLSIEDNSFSRCVVKNLTGVHNVAVNYHISDLGFIPEHINCLLEVLKGISAAKFLTLHRKTAEVLGSALSYVWPSFPYMMTLILQLDFFSGWTIFSKVLHSTPSLELLILDLVGINNVDNRPSGDDNDLYRWTPPDSIPNCLLKHLEIIVIQLFEGNEDELQVIEYLLNNAQMLECMMIGYDPSHPNAEVEERIITFQRASKICDVQIYGQVWFEIIDTDFLKEVTLWGM